MAFDSPLAHEASVLPFPVTMARPATAPPAGPHEPRPLTAAEQRQFDWFGYFSPKLDRRVQVLSCLHLAFGVGQLEFGARTVRYVERPRLLPGVEAPIELSFWSVDVDGRETYWLLVPEDLALPESAGSRRRVHRQARTLIEAANDSGLALRFVFEDDIVAQADQFAAAFRMLPYVQTARRLPHRIALTERVRTVFSTHGASSFAQIEAQLATAIDADVRAVVCDLIHAGELVLDLARPLSRSSIVRRAGEVGHG